MSTPFFRTTSEECREFRSRLEQDTIVTNTYELTFEVVFNNLGFVNNYDDCFHLMDYLIRDGENLGSIGC